jgi:hypothetical protein
MLAARNAATCLARRTDLHGLAPRRCREARVSALEAVVKKLLSKALGGDNKAAFTIVGIAQKEGSADAGLGLAAGVGFSGGLDLGVKDFRRFLGRSVDLVVKTTIDQITALLPANLKDLTATVQAIAPVASAIDINFAIDIFGFTKQISLGRVDLPLGQLFALIRQTFQIVSAFGTSLENAAAALSDALAKQNALQAQNDTLEAKRADRDRLQQIKDEFNASPKEIAILSPLPTQVLDYAVNAQVRLSGVALLGLKKDEQQRVFIFLNGTLIDLKTVAVSTEETAAGAAVQGTAASPLPNPRPPQLLPLQGVASSSAPVIRRSVAKGKSGGTVVSTSLANVLPGRLPDTAQIARLSQSLPPGPTLSWRIDPDGLYAGVNSLAVVIVDPNGKQYQQAVSFVVAGAPRNDPGGARLPPREGVDRPAKLIRTPNGLDLHFNPALVGDALQNAVKSIADQSALHFGR